MYPNITTIYSESVVTINDTVNMYIRMNITQEKLIIGIPLYGSCYKLEDGKNNVTGSASSGPCWKGKWPVLPSYYEICEQLKQNILIQSHDATCNEGPYAIGNDETFTTWTSFDDAFIVQQKSYFVSGNKLGGVSFSVLRSPRPIYVHSIYTYLLLMFQGSTGKWWLMRVKIWASS